MKYGDRLKAAIRGRRKRTSELAADEGRQRRAYEWRQRRTADLLRAYRRAKTAANLDRYRASRALASKAREGTMKAHDLTASSRRKLAAWRRKLTAFRSRLKARLVTRTVAFDGTPVFQGLALMLADARRHGWSGSILSADRRKGVAERFGKKSQWYLYMAYWVWRLPGFNPANPPGRSTHELYSDGVAYAGPIGRKLVWWQLGFDASEPEELRAVLQRLGYDARRPYTDGREAHHVNLYADPRPVLRRRGLL